MFVLLGRDPVASLLVDLWRQIRSELKCTEQSRLDDAEKCAIAMRVWARGMNKSDKIDAAADVLRKLLTPKPVLACDPHGHGHGGADFK